MYDIIMINEFLRDEDIYNTLVDYCKYLASKYDETNEGKYRMKHDELYSFLFHNLSEDKKVEFFNSFATSLNIYPIKKINMNGMFLQTF